MQFDEENLVETKNFLLSASPLGARDIFASVNDFTDHFDPIKLAHFKHSVTAKIAKGSREIVNGLKFVVAQIGTIVKTKVKQGTEYHHITVVVETTLKIFPAQGLFQLRGPEVTTITFNYLGPNLRCFFCFAYGHLPHRCTQPKPAFYRAEDLDPGSEPAPALAQGAQGMSGATRRSQQQRGLQQGGAHQETTPVAQPEQVPSGSSYRQPPRRFSTQQGSPAKLQNRDLPTPEGTQPPLTQARQTSSGGYSTGANLAEGQRTSGSKPNGVYHSQGLGLNPNSRARHNAPTQVWVVNGPPKTMRAAFL